MKPTGLSLSRRGILLGALVALSSRAAWADEPALTFLVLGDWGDPASQGQQVVADAMGRVAADMNSAFVVSTGDNFYRRGVRSVSDRRWRDSFESVYAAASLQTPWYVVLGNHDHEGSVEAQIAYSSRNGRWRMPGAYFKHAFTTPDGSDVEMFFLDTTPIVRDADDGGAVPSADVARQVAWLEEELSASRAPWKLVVGHHPIVSSGVHGGTPVLAARVQPLLERYRVQAYFNGHDHDLEHLRVDGVHYICSGAGSGARPVQAVANSLFVADRVGFASCQLSADELRLRFHDAFGMVIYEASVSSASP